MTGPGCALSVTTDDELVAHLSDGRALFVPGAEPSKRDKPVRFEPHEPLTALRLHPLNPEQRPILVGRIPEFAAQAAWPPGMGWLYQEWSGEEDDGAWCVALSHLAHARSECAQCEPVWQAATDGWADVTESGLSLLFPSVDLSLRDRIGRLNTVSLLVHVADVPDDWW